MGAALIVSTELPSALFVFAGFFCLLKASRSSWPRLCMFLGGLFIMLGLLAKMQIIILVLGLPILLLAWGANSVPVKNGRKEIFLSIGLVLLSLLPIGAAFVLAIVGIFENGESIGYDPTVCVAAKQKNGVYQGLVFVYLLAMIVLYGRLYKTGTRLIIDSWFVLLAGLGVGLFTTLFYFNPGNIVNLVNFVDHLYCLGSVYQEAKEAQNADILPWLKLLNMMGRGISNVVSRRLFWNGSSQSVMG